jgi:cytochrome c oxidase subunit 2
MSEEPLPLQTRSARPLRPASWLLALLAAGSLLRGLGGVGPAWGDAAASAAADSGATALPSPSKAFGDHETGKALFESTCVPCHGANAEGNADLGAPALNRQEPWYLLAQLRKFRGDLRGVKDDDIGGQMMAPMAKSLADEQALLDVATYVSSHVGAPPAPTLRGDKAAGERTFRGICTPCHGVNGVGRPEIRTPALIGQADWYIASQLRKFRHGTRGYHEQDIAGMQMRGMATALPNDKAVVDVATYIASLAK